MEEYEYRFFEDYGASYITSFFAETIGDADTQANDFAKKHNFSWERWKGDSL